MENTIMPGGDDPILEDENSQKILNAEENITAETENNSPAETVDEQQQPSEKKNNNKNE